MKRFIAIVSVLAIVISTAEAVDIRLKGGAVLPSGESSSSVLGVEIGGVTSARSNGVVYGAKLLGMLNDLKMNNGGYVAMDLEFIYRFKHKFEPYVVAGGVYQSVNDYDNAYGWEAGFGARYIFCSGLQLGIEMKSQQMEFQSGQPSSEYLDGVEQGTIVLNSSIGWRF
jgi:hypothetical protein